MSIYNLFTFNCQEETAINTTFLLVYRINIKDFSSGFTISEKTQRKKTKTTQIDKLGVDMKAIIFYYWAKGVMIEGRLFPCRYCHATT